LNLEELRDHCLKKTGATEGLPFGDDTLVFKVGGKMFLLAGIQAGNSFNAKCDPELAIELRERYTEVQPGYHMNKKMWNTVYLDGSLTQKLLIEMIDHSYDLIFNALPRKIKDQISGND
jgi:predicted DNA-binding protein (MmcQ/YjbR family)